MTVSYEQTAGTTARPVALFVLGMPRSGTSALTRVLSLCGATLPAGMLGADSGNPRGYWEPRKALRLNNSILLRHGSGTYDPSLRLQEEGALDAGQKAAYIAEISAYLATLPAAPLVIIKDLQITALSDVWFEATRLAGFDIAIVIAVRRPQEVIASLAKLMRAQPQLSSALWLKYNLLAERQTRGMRRVFVEYDNLLGNWHREIARISTALSIDLSTRDEAAIDEFLKPDLRRQRDCGPVTELGGTDWISATYEAMHQAAQDEPVDESALDRVFNGYRATEHDFRTAFDDYRHHSNNVLVRMSRPFVWKLIEGVALSNRRRGTWA
jgi:hypothetical protein